MTRATRSGTASSPWVRLLAGAGVLLSLKACGGTGSGDSGASDAGLASPDGAAYFVGDAVRPEPPCGVPVRRLTVEGGDIAWGRGDVLVTAAIERVSRPTLLARTTVLTDGSSRDGAVGLPDGDWNAWALALLDQPTVLIGPAVSEGSPTLLWAEVYPTSIEVTLLPVPAEVSFDALPPNMAGWFASGPTGFLRLVSSGGAPHIMRVTRADVNLAPVTLPVGSSRYRVGASESTETGVVAAFGFDAEPGVELALLDTIGVTSPGRWRRVLDWEPSWLALDVNPERTAVTAVREGEVEIVWLDPDLAETGRTRLVLDHIQRAWVAGERPRALVASRVVEPYDQAVLFAILPGGDGVEGLRSLLDSGDPHEGILEPRAWVTGDGRHVVAIPRWGSVDVFVLCGAAP